MLQIRAEKFYILVFLKRIKFIICTYIQKSERITKLLIRKEIREISSNQQGQGQGQGQSEFAEAARVLQ